MIAPNACTLHDVIEQDAQQRDVYPYRCSCCGRCFLCAHRLIDYAFWICHDGFNKPTTFDPGVLVAEAR